jgi:hypothetical protein
MRCPIPGKSIKDLNGFFGAGSDPLPGPIPSPPHIGELI